MMNYTDSHFKQSKASQFYQTDSQQNPQNQYQIFEVEKSLARELQKRKQENEAKQREVEKICSESEELKDLKKKLKMAYVNKERSAQLAEQQVRRFENLQYDALADDICIERAKKEQEQERQKEYQRKLQQLDSKNVLQQQMKEKLDMQEEAYQQYLLEKGQVNKVVLELIEMEKKALEDKKYKQSQAYRDMILAYKEKADNLEKQKQLEKSENEKYLKFMLQKEQQQQQYLEKKAEEERIKDMMYQKVKEEEEKRKQEQDMLEQLREQLYLEEYDAKLRQQDKNEKEKKLRQKLEMQESEQYSKFMKQQQIEEEKRMEQEFKKKLIEQFEREGKLEQMTLEKQRMKKLEFKKEVEILWKSKLELYQREREAQLQEGQQEKEYEEYKKQVIKEEKEKLLREHFANLDGFMPKGIANLTGTFEPDNTKLTQQDINKLAYQSKRGMATKTNFKLG